MPSDHPHYSLCRVTPGHLQPSLRLQFGQCPLLVFSSPGRGVGFPRRGLVGPPLPPNPAAAFRVGQALSFLPFDAHSPLHDSPLCMPPSRYVCVCVSMLEVVYAPSGAVCGWVRTLLAGPGLMHTECHSSGAVHLVSTDASLPGT